LRADSRDASATHPTEPITQSSIGRRSSVITSPHSVSLDTTCIRGTGSDCPQLGPNLGESLWSHVGNLFHGHSWNYGGGDSVTVAQTFETEDQPSASLMFGADGAGLLSAIPDAIPGVFGLSVGLAGGFLSVANDPEAPNPQINAVGGALAITSYALEGTAIGAGAFVGGVGVAALAISLDASKWLTNVVMAPMINSIPGNTMSNGNDVSIPSPESESIPGVN
jgi:hypothetical protein